jgi:hypothetical protein
MDAEGSYSATAGLRKAALVVMVLLTIAAWSRFALNLDHPFLWYDEAGQFWIAKGLNHDSAPLAPEGGLAEVIANNRSYNLDPGGFGVLLHFWTKVTTHHVWLRLLPLALFASAVAALVALTAALTRNLPAALAFGLLPLFSPVTSRMAFEIRAYSLEMLGAIACVVIVYALRRNLSAGRLLLATLALSVFLTSRYSMVVPVFVTGLCVAWLILRSDKSQVERARWLAMFALPLLVTVAAIYLGSMRYQNATAQPLEYLPYLRTNPRILLERSNALFTIGLTVLAVLVARRGAFPRLARYQPMFVVVLASMSLFVLLSVAGYHPWAPMQNKSISVHVLAMLCVAVLGAALLQAAGPRGTALTAIATMLLVAALWPRLLFYGPERPSSYVFYQDARVPKNARIFVDKWESPSTRYLFEYGDGPFRSKYRYPQNFKFEKGLPHTKRWTPEWDRVDRHMNELLEYDLLVAPDLASKGNNDEWMLLPGTTDFYVKKSSLPGGQAPP